MTRIRGAALGALAAVCLAGAGRPVSASGFLEDPKLVPAKVRSAWAELLRIEDGRLPGSGAVRYLRDVDPRIRVLAARTLGRLADRSARPHLTGLLSGDPDGRVRAEAALALGLLGDKDATGALQEALVDVAAAGAAARALGLLGAAEASGALADMAGNSDLPVAIRAAALYALGSMADSPGARRALPARVPEEPELVAAGAWLLRNLVTPGAPEPPPAWRASSDSTVRAAWLRVLGRRRTKAALSDLLKLVPGKGSERAARLALASALGAHLGESHGAEAGKALAGLLDPPDPHVAMAIGSAAATLPATAPLSALRVVLAPSLVRLTEGGEGAVRAAAISGLARIDPGWLARSAARLSASPEVAVRSAVAGGLWGQAPREPGMVAKRLWDDPDRRVRLAAVEALAGSEPAPGSSDPKDGIAERLARVVDGDDPPAIAAAARGLAKRGVAGIGERVWNALRRIPVEHHEERDALVDLLAASGETQRLLPLLVDGDRLLRAKVRGLLGKDLEPEGEPLAESAFYLRNLTRYPLATTVGVETTRGRFRIRLRLAEAPLTAWNFLALAGTGFYDGLGFHRVVPGFVAQGGDPRGDGYGGPGYMVRCERSLAPYRRGTVGMALAGRDTGGSQFFVTYDSFPHLEAGYSVLGEVIEGMDAVDRLLPGDSMLEVRVE